MQELGGYDFVYRNALRDGRDLESTTKQKVTKIDYAIITFFPNDKSKALCIYPFIDNFNK
jgi:hypothetical protein